MNFVRILTILMLAAALRAQTPSKAPATSQPTNTPVMIDAGEYEFRGLWVATVANIDWPSQKGLPVNELKKELLAILDRAAELNFNAIVLQVRPMADALYPSELEPWSEFLTGAMGKAPADNFDPLAFAVAECHQRNLQLHAWFNPYRAGHPSAKTPASANHITVTHPDLAPVYGKHRWMIPTEEVVRAHSLKVMLDVVKRYDVDGIHMDDYFYPYKEKEGDKEIEFPDAISRQRYEAAGGKLLVSDWRRDAVNQFVKQLYSEVKNTKPKVQVGISPFGIWRPGNPKGIEGFDQHEGLYADAKLWLEEGWVDYYSPQLYWPINQKKQSFPKLLAWWYEHNPKHRQIWPGIIPSRVSMRNRGWSPEEIGNQIALTRVLHEIDQTRHSASHLCPGTIHFSAKAIMNNSGGVADVVKKMYAKPANAPVLQLNAN